MAKQGEKPLSYRLRAPGGFAQTAWLGPLRNSYICKPQPFTDVLQARRNVERHLPRTPLVHYPALDQLVGTRVLVKHENHLPTGAFKVRGGVNLLSQLSSDERARGVIAASTGNHGQSVAYAAQLFGVDAVVVVPEGANPLKVAAMRNYGAEVLFHGHGFRRGPCLLRDAGP